MRQFGVKKKKIKSNILGKFNVAVYSVVAS